MRRIAIGLALIGGLALIPAGRALADPDIGCGIGTQLWEGNRGVLPKVLGATTNGMLGQSFGISFGTIGCHQGGTVTADARLYPFAGGNMDRLAEDMARGQGETLATFAHLLGIAESDRPAFYSFTKAHFAELFAGDAVTEADMIAALTTLMAKDETLAVYVRS
jgi:Protein of unknown function (DUF3015)